MNVEDIVLSERNQSQKSKSCMKWAKAVHRQEIGQWLSGVGEKGRKEEQVLMGKGSNMG